MTPHICGLCFIGSQKQFLPLVDAEAHTTILETTSRTILTQTYLNPSSNEVIPELQYTFPLYDGVSVVGFTCRIGDRTIIGQVMERQRAKREFKDAVIRGDKAAVLEQLPSASDVFTTTVGNIPAGVEVVVEITYIGELKHDAEVNGTRFTIPTSIMPRYGSLPVELNTKSAISRGRLQVTVDVVLAQSNVIQRVQSPSHPITVSLGTTSFAPNANAVMSKASATLSLGDAALDKDFIIQVVSKDTGVPTAILETHPRIPNQRALMTTLVPKFALPAERPELVFICDCSGSMSGSNINLVRSALKVLLRSLPVGIKFNLCSFGSSYSFLWSKSVTYSQTTLNQAVKHVESITADMGGTEMFQPIKAALDRRYKDIPLAVMLLTDGEVWDQESLFAYLNKEIIEAKAPIRVFTLGIGNGVSHALIEGVAKAGNGFSQSVGVGEKMEGKVVRMLKGALTPHVFDYTLEVRYTSAEVKIKDIGDDAFEIVEKVIESLDVAVNLADETKAEPESVSTEKRPISLFDPSVDLELEGKELAATPEDIDTGEAMFASLPTVAPKLLQTPHIIPPLYAFNRTNVYLLMGQQCSSLTPKSVVLRGISRHGPLEIEIPIQVLDTPGETIHQLAAKSAIAELEQGRGWITQLKDESDGQLFRLKYESRFVDMVEREAVRLGVQFQVGGKWCSFVAAETRKESGNATRNEVELLRMVTKEEQEEATEGVIITKETGEVAKPAVSEKSSWFRRAISGAEAAALGAGALVVGAGAVAVGVTAGVALGAGHAASDALHKVDGVWKRTVQVLTTRKAKVDHVCPIAETAYVYYDDEVYDSVLVEKSTGITYVIQLIFNCETKVYYVYYRWGETDYKLDGPHDTIESAKDASRSLTRRTSMSSGRSVRSPLARWTYEVKTYETFEEIEEVEEVIEEKEAEIIIAREKEIEVDNSKVAETTTTTTTEEIVTVEHETKEETIVVEEETETIKEIVTEKETGKVETPAVSQKSSWFRRALSSTEAAALGAGALVVGAGAVAVGVATGAGHAATGALEKVDGVWKRTVQVLTNRKAHVDHVCPIAKTSSVYYDDEVYDAVLVEKSTGITYVIQLIFNSETKTYYVYYRWGETDYKLDGPHDTIESAKEVFQVTYKEKFDVEWTERETTVSERWTYEVKTYDIFEELEECEKIEEENEFHTICTSERQVVATDEKVVESINIMICQDETLIDLQTFEGFWEWKESLFSWVGADPILAAEVIKKHGWDFRVAATAFAIVFLEKKQTKEKDAWELVVEKAKGWMEEQIGVHEVKVVLHMAAEVLK